VYTYPYNSLDYNPSAPVLDIRISQIGDESGHDRLLFAMIDSGADGTILPLADLLAIKAQYVRDVFMRDVTGSRHAVELYTVSIRIGPYKVRSARVIADPTNSEAILGRNVLNQFIVTLNGLASSTEITD